MTYNVMETCMLFDVGLKPSDCASWVQAWGTVIAILMSGLIAWLQISAAKRSTLRAQRDRAVAMVEAVAELAQSFALQVNSLTAQLAISAIYNPNRKRGWTFDPFRNLEASVLALQLHDLPDAESVRLLIGFRNLVTTSDAAFKRLDAMMDDPDQVAAVNAGAVGHLVAAAEFNDQQWKSLVKRLSQK